MKIVYYASFKTEKEAMEHSNLIIGGGIVQLQGEEWCVFGIQR